VTMLLTPTGYHEGTLKNHFKEASQVPPSLFFPTSNTECTSAKNISLFPPSYSVVAAVAAIVDQHKPDQRAFVDESSDQPGAACQAPDIMMVDSTAISSSSNGDKQKQVAEDKESH